ncbi:hypothetical protein Tco_1465364 [Tanacetum coccineum]
MTTLKFANTHNMVAFLAKPAESEGFEQIVDFLNAHTIKYALTVNPTIYTSCIEQFCTTVKAKTVNREVQLQALVDGKNIIITRSIVRRDLQLEDAEGVDCLPNATIFEHLTQMGSKTTAWNEFSSTMTSVIICLDTNQKFNFSKYIFESMVKNLENVSGKILDVSKRIAMIQEKEDNVNNTNNVNAASTNEVNVVDVKTSIELPLDPNMPELEDYSIIEDDENVGAEDDMNNLDTTIQVSPILTIRIYKDHPLDQVIEISISSTLHRSE